MKISLIVGTRPQIIKSQPIIKELVSNNIGITSKFGNGRAAQKITSILLNEL